MALGGVRSLPRLLRVPFLLNYNNFVQCSHKIFIRIRYKFESRTFITTRSTGISELQFQFGPIGKNVTKANTSPAFMKQISLQTIQQRYPEEEWLHLYTDGSYIDKGAGAGAYCKLFSHYIPVGENKTNFDAELEAIQFSLAQLLHRVTNFKKVVFLVDSKSAIQKITSQNASESATVTDIRNSLKLLTKINFQWVPSHIGLSENELADNLAKKGTKIVKTNNKIPLTSVKTLIRTN